jgi:hypothetical protein
MAIIQNLVLPIVATTAFVGIGVAMWNDFVEMMLP